jgi:hypothetical protein
MMIFIGSFFWDGHFSTHQDKENTQMLEGFRRRLLLIHEID